MYMSGAVIRTTEIEIYESLIVAIQSYFRGKNNGYMFLYGGFRKLLGKIMDKNTRKGRYYMWRDKNNLKTQLQNLTGIQFPCKKRLLVDSVTIYTDEQ